MIKQNDPSQAVEQFKNSLWNVLQYFSDLGPGFRLRSQILSAKRQRPWASAPRDFGQWDGKSDPRQPQPPGKILKSPPKPPRKAAKAAKPVPAEPRYALTREPDGHVAVNMDVAYVMGLEKEPTPEDLRQGDLSPSDLRVHNLKCRVSELNRDLDRLKSQKDFARVTKDLKEDLVSCVALFSAYHSEGEGLPAEYKTGRKTRDYLGEVTLDESGALRLLPKREERYYPPSIQNDVKTLNVLVAEAEEQSEYTQNAKSSLSTGTRYRRVNPFDTFVTELKKRGIRSGKAIATEVAKDSRFHSEPWLDKQRADFESLDLSWGHLAGTKKTESKKLEELRKVQQRFQQKVSKIRF